MHSSARSFFGGAALAAACLLFHPLRADVTCARLFTDHMVLQRDQPVPVWGTAAAGEEVTVSFAGQTKQAQAAADGHWRVRLDPLATSATPRDLVVRARNTVTFTDVLVGEVWFCSGQSNMAKPLGEQLHQHPSAGYDLEIAAGNLPLLRLYQVPRLGLKQDGPGVFHWLPCSPQALRDSNFSAVAFHFGRQVQLALGIPVGLIQSTFGGTRLEAWLPPAAFTDPVLAGLEKEKYPTPVAGIQPTELYRSMIAPYAPYALRGFLWYQGESNCLVPDSDRYDRKLTILIRIWRELWERPEAPFYGVLLAPFDYSRGEKNPTTVEALPRFWQAQIQALSAPHTGYAVTTDLVDDTHDIHPVKKREIGDRLARLALVETYGRTDLIARGPTLVSVAYRGNTAELTFAPGDELYTRDGLPPDSFTLAGTDQVFHPAKAVIAGNRLTLTSPEVSAPVAVRFAWSETATPNLVNHVSLPAVPFRTDNWPVVISRSVPATP